MSISELNDLYFEKLGIVDDYIQKRKNLDEVLKSASHNISRAKINCGISLFSVKSIETYELEPSVHVNVINGKFKVRTGTEEKDENKPKNRKTGETEEVEPEKPAVAKNQFRPFGILESTAAKEARKQMKSSIELICELATARQQLLEIDEKIQNLYKNSVKDEEIVQKLKTLVVN